MEELKKVFDVMHGVYTERVKIVLYQIKNVDRTWFDRLKEGKVRMHHLRVGFVLKKLCWHISFPGN